MGLSRGCNVIHSIGRLLAVGRDPGRPDRDDRPGAPARGGVSEDERGTRRVGESGARHPRRRTGRQRAYRGPARGRRCAGAVGGVGERRWPAARARPRSPQGCRDSSGRGRRSRPADSPIADGVGLDPPSPAAWRGSAVALWSTDVLRGFFGLGYQGDALNIDSASTRGLSPRVSSSRSARGMLTGIAPALQATRPDTLPALKDETAGTTAPRTSLREGLIVVQLAVCVLLLSSSGLLVRSFSTLHKGPEFDPDAVVLLRLRPSLLGYTGERAWRFQREAIPRCSKPFPAWSPPVPPTSRRCLAGKPATNANPTRGRRGRSGTSLPRLADDPRGAALLQGARRRPGPGP